METIDWNDLSNSEIETKLKTLEFEYEKVKTDITNLYSKLDNINKNYNNGKVILDKRMHPQKYKK